MPHQAFADQEGRNADAGEAGEVGRRIEPAFGDHDAVARDFRRQLLADREGGLESAQIAVVDADQARPQPKGTFKLIFCMNFKQYVHIIGKGCIFDLFCRRIVDRRHDDQDAIGAKRARFDHLIGLVDEILAQNRQGGGVTRRAEEFRFALE